MTPKRFDEVILEVFESPSDSFYFPIVSQGQAKAFVRALHDRGVAYEEIGREIQETREKFSSWRRSLSRGRVGQRIIRRINRPMTDLLEDAPDVPVDFESLFEVEPDFFSFQKTDINKNSKLWRLLRGERDARRHKKLFEIRSENCVEEEFTSESDSTETCTDRLSCPTSDVPDVLPEFVGSNECIKEAADLPEATCESEAVRLEVPPEDESIYFEADRSMDENETKLARSALALPEEEIRSTSELSSNEDQFFDCDSFKSCSSAFAEDPANRGVAGLPSLPDDDDSNVSHEQEVVAHEREVVTHEREVVALHDVESYDSDADDSSNETKRLLRTCPGFLYIFCEKGSLPNILFKVGSSRNPEKRFLQASSFNIKLLLAMKFRVANMHQAMMMVLEKMDKWKVSGRVDWFQGSSEECLKALEDLKKDLSFQSQDDQNCTL